MKWTTGDFDGDGKTDIVAAWNNNGTNTLTMRPSSGTEFGVKHWATDVGGWMDTTVWCAGDFG